MSCEEVNGLVDAYIDRELDVVAAVRFERHLKECDGCRANCDRYQSMQSAVRERMTYYAAPSRLEDGIRAKLRAGKRDGEARTPRDWFPRWPGWQLAASLAVLLLLFSATTLQWARRPRADDLVIDQVVSNHIRSLMADHLKDVISSDQHTVKPWFGGKLDFAPVVKDLAANGFPLVGGRLDYLNKRRVAALVYKRRQHTINVFQWPAPDSDSGLKSATSNGYNVVHWTQAQMAYWAVSDLNAGELSEFARELGK